MTDADRAYAEQKLRRLDRHFDPIHDVRLEIEGTRLKSAAPIRVLKVQVHVNGSILKARVEGADVRGGVDRVFEKIDEQLRRRKERIQEHRATPASGQPRVS